MQEPYKLPYCQYVQPNRWWYLAYSKHVKREESKKNPSCYPKCDDIYIHEMNVLYIPDNMLSIPFDIIVTVHTKDTLNKQYIR